ncbi:hypothetical protein EB796_002392 [Bugula neritina]|uniref:Uncharacterized protein n=1 Tax=Bugula neritina TaxID=10212 RepID=A0A7J7KMB7_BUGNE|nr:hypothetical protein EB796_022410 [Bugula neritina]KAF6039299.1 hypothetical protein EB796_002392 [Bugula neritina]
MLDMDTAKMTKDELHDAFNNLYVSLPLTYAQIDESSNCVGVEKASQEKSNEKPISTQAERQNTSNLKPADKKGENVVAVSQRIVENTKPESVLPFTTGPKVGGEENRIITEEQSKSGEKHANIDPDSD